MKYNSKIVDDNMCKNELYFRKKTTNIRIYFKLFDDILN